VSFSFVFVRRPGFISDLPEVLVSDLNGVAYVLSIWLLPSLDWGFLAYAKIGFGPVNEK
jgi:hypothetical protein